MLYALMVKSANDAGVVLAEASAGSVEAFVDKMNAKAAQLGLKNTHFTNPHGLDTPGYTAGYSSARDLATMAQYAMKNAEFRKLVGTVNWSITMPGDTKQQTFRNHNELLGTVSWVTGVKTGFTNRAGFCLVASGTQNGASLIGVVLGEKTQPPCWADSKALLQFGFAQYQRISLVQQGVPAAEMPLPYRLGEKLELATERSVDATVLKGDKVTSKVSIQPDLVLPVQAGQVYGKVLYTAGGLQVASVDLVAARSVAKVTLGLKVAYFWHRLTKWLGG
jgi:D-alanyl-D-alanine carboxypeptidase